MLSCCCRAVRGVLVLATFESERQDLRCSRGPLHGLEQSMLNASCRKKMCQLLSCLQAVAIQGPRTTAGYATCSLLAMTY